jgi:Ran GTPase-activating protein (RanGAP) involved in mRNA processing and transport
VTYYFQQLFSLNSIAKQEKQEKMSFTSSSDLQPSDTTTVASGGSFSSLSSPVTVVNLCHKNLSSIDLIRMAEQFTIESTVHTLRLGFNDFGDAGAKTVANLLNRYHSITCLDLGFCNIGDIGIESLASHLSLSSCRIEILYLSGNRLTPLGLKHLSNALSTNSSIQRLYLTANEGGPDGAKWIAKGLGSNHSLTSLTINVNKMGSAGADAIADMLAKNDSLTHLNLVSLCMGYSIVF